MRTVLFYNNAPIGVFALTVRDEDVKTLILRKSVLDPSTRIRTVKLPTIRADESVMANLYQAANLAANLPADELREQLLNCYEDWLEVCQAVTDKPGHLNPDELIAKIKELKK